MSVSTDGWTIYRKRRANQADKKELETSSGVDVPVKRIFGPIPDLKQLHSENWSWQQNDEISTSYVQHLNKYTVFFHPNYSHGTAAALGNKQLTKDVVAFWEIHVEFVYGTAMMFGIGKGSSKLLSPIFFENLIGAEDTNYGLSHKGFIYHNGFVRRYCEAVQDRKPVTIGVFFDGPRRQLSYFINGEYLGVAFEDLALDNDSVFYPMISSTSQKSKFIVTEQKQKCEANSLFELCAQSIMNQLQSCNNFKLDKIKKLGLPKNLIKFLARRLEQQEELELTMKFNQSFKANDQEPMETETAEPPGDVNYDLIDSLPPTIGERLMQILWAGSIPSQL
ncbi:SPRY domain-containing SOCS box protein 3 [Aphelenchoides bicaudatus]|nr:SPRY domain-containing SOCS box protein 3 [Aphelenchoides bicaudatus]